MNIRRANLRIIVSDFRESFCFYRDVLGLSLDFGTEDDVVAEFDAGTVLVTIVDISVVKETLGSRASLGSSEHVDRTILVFQLEDLDETIQELTNRGLAISDPLRIDEWHIRVSHCRDPDGNLIEMQSVPE